MVRIASVDDDRMFQSMLIEMLQLEGWTVMAMNDESTAFQQLLVDPPDLILLDVRMGTTEGGWKLLEQLTANTVTQSIPVIVCSAASRSLQEKQQWLSDLGVTTLLKPFDIDDLYRCVRKALHAGELPPTQ